jgi:hypothetical protein
MPSIEITEEEFYADAQPAASSSAQPSSDMSAMSAQYQAPQRTGADPYASMFQAGSTQQLQTAVDDAGKIGEQKAVQGESGQYVTPYFQRPGVMTAPPSVATSEEEKKRAAQQLAISLGIVGSAVAPAFLPEALTTAATTGTLGTRLLAGGAIGGTSGAASGAFQAIPELLQGEYGEAGKTALRETALGAVAGPVVSEGVIPIARQFVKPAIAAKEFFTGEGFKGAMATFFRPRYSPRVGSLETSQIRDIIESSTGVRVPLGVSEAIGEPGLVEAIKNAPIGAEVTPQQMEGLKRLIVLNATELGGKNTGITTDELAKSAVDILRKRLGAVSKPFEDAIGTLSAQLKPSIDKGLIDVQNAANALVPGTVSTPSFLGNIFREFEQSGYNFFKQTDAKNFNAVRNNETYQNLKGKVSNMLEWANDTDAQAIQSLKTTPEESALLLDQFGRKVVSKPSAQTTQGIPSTYPPDTQKFVAAIGNMAPEQSIDAMRNYRTIIGDSIGNDSILPGISDRSKKQLYKAITKDIDVMIDGASDAELKAQLQGANKFHRENADNFVGRQVQSIIKDVGAQGGTGPASIARNLESADAPTFLQSIKAAARPEDAAAIDSTAKEYLFNQAAKSGLDPVTGEISVSKVVNYINGLAPEIQSRFFPNSKQISELARRQSALAGLDPNKVVSSLTVDAKVLSDALGSKAPEIQKTIAGAIKAAGEKEKQLRGTILGALKKASSSDVTDIVSQNPKKFISGIVDGSYTPEQSRAALDMIGRESPMLVEQLQFQYINDLIEKYTTSGVLNSKKLASELAGESILGKASDVRNYADAILGGGKVSKLKSVLDNVARLEQLKAPVASNDAFVEAVIRGAGAVTGEVVGGIARVGPIGVANQAVRIAKLAPGVRYKIASYILSTPKLRELAMKPIGRFSKDELNGILRGTAAGIVANEGEDSPDIDELQNLER